MPRKKLKSVSRPSAKSDDQPITRKMLTLTRKELIHRMDAGFSGIDSRLTSLESGNARMLFLLEEQNANNRIVLEGLQALWQRQDRLEEKVNSKLGL